MQIHVTPLAILGATHGPIIAAAVAYRPLWQMKYWNSFYCFMSCYLICLFSTKICKSNLQRYTAFLRLRWLKIVAHNGSIMLLHAAYLESKIATATMMIALSTV